MTRIKLNTISFFNKKTQQLYIIYI